MTKKNILFLTPRFPFPLIGGDRLKPYNLMKHLAKKHNVTLISFYIDLPIKQAYLKEIEALGVELIAIPLYVPKAVFRTGMRLFGHRPLEIDFFTQPEFRKAVNEQLQKKKFDIGISFFMRTRVHMIPVTDESGIMLIELLCQSRDGLDALKETIECIENNRVELAYQKQYDLITGEVSGVEALLRLQDGKGGHFPNDKVIPLIEGEKLFSLIVLESLNQIKKYFDAKDALGLSNTTVYLNVSAHTIMHQEFCKIFSRFVEENGIKENEFGLEITETAELEDTKKAAESLTRLKKRLSSVQIRHMQQKYETTSIKSLIAQK